MVTFDHVQKLQMIKFCFSAYAQAIRSWQRQIG
jgi:hypothetical protein